MKYVTEWMDWTQHRTWRSDDKLIEYTHAAGRIKLIANAAHSRLFYRMVDENGIVVVAVYAHNPDTKRLFITLPGRILQQVTLEAFNDHLDLD